MPKLEETALGRQAMKRSIGGFVGQESQRCPEDQAAEREVEWVADEAVGEHDGSGAQEAPDVRTRRFVFDVDSGDVVKETDDEKREPESA